MEPRNQLNVWYRDQLVGTLWQNVAGVIGFRYTKTWIANGFPISQQLPLLANDYSEAEGKAHQFFANLLPEADARLHIVRDLKLSNTDFELLRALGGECAGALSILPVDYQQSPTPHYKKLSASDLKKIIQRQGRIFYTDFKINRPRLSLAGAQDKCLIFLNQDDYFLPEETAPSTHILKFELSHYKNIPLYEYFLAQLATHIELPTINIQLKKNDAQFYLLIKRYDRILTKENDVIRLHQEDFCQALGVSYARKYQQDGGPSFLDCYQLIKRVCTHPTRDLKHLLKWQMFNVFTGNSDGHAKNISLIYDEHHKAHLAPFYDLVCTRAIDRIDPSLALSVGDEFNPDQVKLMHWKALAEACELREDDLLNLLQHVAEQLLNTVAHPPDAFQCLFETHPALQRVKFIVQRQCKKILKQL